MADRCYFCGTPLGMDRQCSCCGEGRTTHTDKEVEKRHGKYKTM